MQVRDGDILKWDTYDEAYNQALSILDENEKETNFERDIQIKAIMENYQKQKMKTKKWSGIKPTPFLCDILKL